MRIIPFEPNHIEWLEIESESFRIDNLMELATDAMQGPCWTGETEDGKVIGAAGLRPTTTQGEFIAWAVFGPLLHQNRFSVHKYVKRWLHVLNGLEDYGRIIAHIDSTDEKARHWAWAMGFRPTGVVFQYQGRPVLIVYLPKEVA